MKIKYFNYSQAKAISADYQHIVGMPFEKESNEHQAIEVQQVIVAPYSRILQWQFLRSLLRGMPHEEALSICPNGRYDVLVLPNEQPHPSLGFRMKTLRNYLQDQELAFNPDIYNCLRTT